MSAVLYTCGKPIPTDWLEVLKKEYPVWINYYDRVANKFIYYDETLKPEEKEYVFVRRLSPECPNGEEYAWFVMDVFLPSGQCRRIVMLPQSPNIIEEYGPCPPGVKPPEEIKQML